MMKIFSVLLVAGLISLSVYNFIKLNHKEQELEELRNAIYILTSNNTELQESRGIPQSQKVTLNEKLDELTKEFSNLQERVDKETSEWKRNNNNLQESLDTLQSQYERNYTEIQKSQDLLKSEVKKSQNLLKSEIQKSQNLLKSEIQKSQNLLKSELVTNYTELKRSQDLLKSESDTNYSNLQQSHDSLQSQYVTLNEKLDEVTKEFSVLKEIYCDGTNTSPDNTCSLCKPGWVLFSSKCYFFSTNELTWKASRDWCETRRGRLVNVESSDLQDFIKRKGPDSNYWIGGYNISKENKSTRMGAEPVKSKRASDDDKEECLEMHVRSTNVYNFSCEYPLRWICESAVFLLRI